MTQPDMQVLPYTCIIQLPDIAKLCVGKENETKRWLKMCLHVGGEKHTSTKKS